MIAAGEASGDLHGSNLVKAAKEMSPGLEFFGMGGERLRAAGVDLLVDLEHMSLMGVAEIVSKLGHVWSSLNLLKAAMAERRPAALVVIDYPDFNLNLAKAAHRLGIPVFYYITPQVWAWRRGRLKTMARYVDCLAVILPFEEKFFRGAGLNATFVGHPLLDALPEPRPRPDVRRELGLDPDRPLLALFPGSRKPLVGQLMPIMLETVRLLRQKRPELAVAVAQAETLNRDFLDGFLSGAPDGIEIIHGRSHQLQNAADAALAASGTTTLETALMLTPMVVVYRLKWLSWLIGKLLISVDHVSLANLIAGRRLVPELLQNEARPDKIAAELERILNDPAVMSDMVAGLREVREKLGRAGASRRAAGLLLTTAGLEVRPLGESAG